MTPPTTTRPALSTEQWQRVFALYDGDAATNDDAAEVLAALAYLRAEQLRDAPETRDFNRVAEAVLGVSEPNANSLLGRYRLLAPIARGGMGSVWRAERADGLYSKTVAIKLLGSLALSAHARARFIREGELLAKLDHPNIARLLDVGLTDDGQRFLALELVDGNDIASFCADKSEREVLRVFRQLLSAVAYAHSQLVLHRDIKPQNVLVDREGRVKLLDFGVAKLADDSEFDDGLTRALGRALTERYAAPEQFTDDSVGTAADVFALGSVLIELLSGEKIAWSHPKKSWSNESVSVSLKTSLAHLPDDLRAIASKATARDAEDRYATASELDDDLARYLSSEPVRAKAPTSWYRFQKFVRRRRAPLAIVGAACVAIIASLLFALYQLGETRQQERLAKSEAEKAKAIATFTTGLFTVLDPKVASTVDRSKLTAKEILDAGRERIKTELHGQPEVRIAMLGTLAEIYGRLGEEKSFVEVLGEQISLAKSHYGEHHPMVYEAQMVDVWSDLYGGLYADARRKLAEIDASAGARGEVVGAADERTANRLFAWAKISGGEGIDSPEKVIERYEAAVAEFVRAKSNSADFSAARASLATSLVNANRLEQAANEFTQAIAQFEAAKSSDAKTANIGDLSVMLMERGKVYASLKRPADAERDMRRAIDLMAQSSGPDHLLTKIHRADFALTLHRQDRRDEAWAQFRLIDATAPTAVIGTQGVEQIQQLRSRMLAREGKFDAALIALSEAIDGWRRANNNPTELVQAERLLSRIEDMRANRKTQSPNR